MKDTNPHIENLDKAQDSVARPGSDGSDGREHKLPEPPQTDFRQLLKRATAFAQSPGGPLWAPSHGAGQ